MFLKKTFKKIKNDMDYTSVGGSPFLGIEKVLIKAHGSSKAKSIYAAILQAKQTYESGVIDKLKEYSASVLAHEEES